MRRSDLSGLMISFVGVHLVVNVANGAIANYLIPLHVELIDPARKVVNLGLVTTAAAAVGLAAQPAFGMLSDRTRTSRGRRVPWIVGGVTGLSAAFAGLSFADTIAAMIVLGALVQAFYSMTAAPLSAIVADRIPTDARALFSALAGIGIFFGALAGTFVAARFAHHVADGYRLFTVVVLCAIPLAWSLRRDSRDLPRAPWHGLRNTLAELWVSPRRNPDFAWAFASRLLLVSGAWAVFAYLLYILQDYVGLGRDKAAAVYPLAAAVMVIALLITIVPVGLYSDRTGRRKPVVVVSSLVIGASAAIPMMSPTLTAVLIALAISGAATGAYMAVDQALMTLVLPRVTDAGKDLGILNIAQAGGQLLAPALASVVIETAGYRWLYAVVVTAGLAGAVTVLPIRSVS
ncbi:MFS transporter [Virgisporangium aurantiacum]